MILVTKTSDVCVFHRASTIPRKIYAQSSTWSAGQENIRETLTELVYNERIKTKTIIGKNDKKGGKKNPKPNSKRNISR